MGDILEALAAEAPLSAADIAERIDEPLSSVYRLLRTMRERQYVASPRRGEFQLGMRVFELGAAVSTRFSLRDAARPAMERLRAETDGTVLLFIRRGDRAVCIDRVDGRWVRLEIVDVGESLPLHTGASPRLLLAQLDDTEIDDYLDGARLEQHTQRSPATPREVRRLVEQIRHDGYAVSDQDLVLGVASIAAPVRDQSGAAIAGMSYSGLAETLLGGGQRERSIELVSRAADEASRQLGWTGGKDG